MASPCSAWLNLNGTPTSPDDPVRALLERNENKSVVIIAGSHDRLELSARLKSTLRDNETLAQTRATAVAEWLKARITPSNKNISYVLLTRPPASLEMVHDGDRTVRVTIISIKARQ
jgi:hypothetical protein